MGKKNMRRLPSILVTAQTAKNLERLANMCGYREIGRVVDKLTREKMLSLHTATIAEVVRLDDTGEKAMELAAEVSELRQRLAEAEKRYIKLGTSVRYMDELYTKIKIVTGLTVEQILKMFSEGWMLAAPSTVSLSQIAEEMESQQTIEEL